MTEYQTYVAEKARQLTAMMAEAAKTDAVLAKLLNAMQSDLVRIAQGQETLPSRLLNGWTWYFLWENRDRIDEKYPEISQCKAELSSLMAHSSMANYVTHQAFLKSL